MELRYHSSHHGHARKYPSIPTPCGPTSPAPPRRSSSPIAICRCVAAVEEFYGVRTSLTETVGEYFHTFRNVDLLIEGFQTILLRNWSYFERSDERADAVRPARRAGARAAPRTSSPTLSSRCCCAACSTWCTAALNGPHGDAYDDSLDDHRRDPEPLAARAAARPSSSATRCSRDLVSRAARRPALAPAYTELYRAAAADRLPPHSTSASTCPAGPWPRAPDSPTRRPSPSASSFLAKRHLAGLLRRRRDRLRRGAAAARPSRVLRHPRAGDRPALPASRTSRTASRSASSFSGRHARLPPERGHGRPAGRRQADDAARQAHGRRTRS